MKWVQLKHFITSLIAKKIYKNRKIILLKDILHLAVFVGLGSNCRKKQNSKKVVKVN